MLRCPTCAETYPPGTRFCRLDGTRLVEAEPAAAPANSGARVCPTCGATYPAGLNFCRLDGTPLVGHAPATRPRVQPLTVRPVEAPPFPPAPPRSAAPLPASAEDDPPRWAPPARPEAPAERQPDTTRRTAPTNGTALDALALLLGADAPAAPPQAPAETSPVQEEETPAFEAIESEAAESIREDAPSVLPEPDPLETPTAAPEEAFASPVEDAAMASDAEWVGPPAQQYTDEAPDGWTGADPAEAEPADDLPEFAPLDPAVSEPSPFDPSPYAPHFDPRVEPEPPTLFKPEPPADALATTPNDAPPDEHADAFAMVDAPRQSSAPIIALIVGLLLLAVAIGATVLMSRHGADGSADTTEGVP